MSNLITELHKDHLHLAKLLKILEKQANALSEGESSDLLLMIDIADYIHDYVDQIHHPKEDEIYHFFQKNSDQAQEIIAALLEEHKKLPKVTEDFRNTLNYILNLNVIADRGEVSSKVMDFIQTQFDHMRTEEEKLFPVIERVLNEKDLSILESHQPAQNDPLFGENVVEKYLALSERVLD